MSLQSQKQPLCLFHHFSPLPPPPSLFSHTPPPSSSPCWVVNGVRVLAGVRADAALCPWPLASSQATHDHGGSGGSGGSGGWGVQRCNSGMRVFVVMQLGNCSYRSGQMIQYGTITRLYKNVLYNAPLLSGNSVHVVLKVTQTPLPLRCTLSHGISFLPWKHCRERRL